MTSAIDTERSRHAALTWSTRGDALFRLHLDLRAELNELELDGGSIAGWALAAAATELWVSAVFLRSVIDTVESADDWSAALDVALLLQRAGASVPPPAIGASCPTFAAWSFSPATGDPGETFDLELRAPFYVTGDDPPARGRSVVVRALVDASSSIQIRADEFEVVRLSSGRHLVVLPGVVDLSTPGLGLDAHHRSVRDLDQHAYPSSRSTSVDDNRYAQLVRDGLVAAGVPTGAELMIVGHSFGADTALDLAADPAFNGPGGFDVTHVVAAGYHSGPQLADVRAGTEVLVLQNHRDVAVIAEAVGHGHVTNAFEARRSLVDSIAGLDPVGALRHLGAAAFHEAGALAAGAGHLFDHRDDVLDVGVGIATHDAGRLGEALVDLATLDPGVEVRGDHVVDVFDGGGAGLGHAPANYIDHVTEVDHPAVTAFFASVAGAGYATSGASLAIDVSVPVDD